MLLQNPKYAVHYYDSTCFQAAVPDYDPVHFIRCHSGGGDYEDDDPEDNETQIWACAFEPPSKKSSKFPDSSV